MKKYFFSVITMLFLTGYASYAQGNDVQNPKDGSEQKDGDEANKKLGEYDEIIIKKKHADANEKLTIEINNDQVTVNGKPIDDFSDDAVSVRVRSPKHYMLTSPPTPFRYPGRSWYQENNSEANMKQPFLGVMTEKSPDGAKITAVTEMSAAEKAGLKKDDVITKVNNEAVADNEQLSRIIGQLKPDDKVNITYLRSGKENRTTAVLGKRPINERRFYMNPGGSEGSLLPVPPMGFNFDNPGDHFGGPFNNMDNRPRIGIRAQDTEDGKGVKVLNVDDDSPADKAGLKEDDIITSFDGKSVNSASELAEASHASKNKPSVKIQFKRNGKTMDIELKVPKKLKTANL